jgi:hypothetical protein
MTGAPGANLVNEFSLIRTAATYKAAVRGHRPQFTKQSVQARLSGQRQDGFGCYYDFASGDHWWGTQEVVTISRTAYKIERAYSVPSNWAKADVVARRDAAGGLDQELRRD